MEGVYRFLNYNENRKVLINSIFHEKESYKICSFSDEKAFSNPIMWGYYANGFRGVAVEIEVNRDEVKKMEYVDEIPCFEGVNPNDEAVKILTTKLSPWKHEYEYRFLKQNEQNEIKIGNISALYFGDPYEKAKNKEDIIQNSVAITQYRTFKDDILKSMKGINTHSIKIENCQVTKVKPNDNR
jgi:hypothetical protein